MRRWALLLPLLALSSSLASAQALPDRLTLERDAGATDPRHAVTWHGDHARLLGPAASDVRVTAEGAHLALGGHEVRLGLVSVHRGERALPLVAGSARIVGPEVRSVRAPGIEEWWRSLPSGLEHGVDLAHRPAGTGELVLEVAAHGLRARLEGDDRVVLESGAQRLVYTGLVVRDAEGARIPARMDVACGRIALRVDDHGARYPLRVDPIVASLEQTLSELVGRFGTATAISGDASTVAVGATFGPRGSVFVYRRAGSSWALERRIDGTTGEFANVLALSASGDALVIGAPDEATTGVVHVWERTGATWTSAAALTPSDATDAVRLGESVAISDDGRTVVAGAPTHRTLTTTRSGHAYVFERGGTWTESAILHTTPEATDTFFGYSVAIDGGAQRVLVGAYGTASAYVFHGAGSAWAEEAHLSEPTAGAFGISTAIDATGTRVIIGANFADGVRGSASIYARTGASWGRESVLRPTGASSGDQFGTQVALAGDGTLAVVGSSFADTPAGTDAGRVWVFAGGAGGWAERLVLDGPGPSAATGAGVDVDGAAGRLIVGSYGAHTADVYTLARTGTNGVGCVDASECDSGFCTDGVCCAVACAGGTADCQACAGALTGGADGVCAPIPVGSECRAGGGDCDLAEVCDGLSPSCPADTLVTAGTECRGSVGECDAAEACDGVSPSCPADVLASAGTACGTGLGPCAAPRACTGASLDCPPLVLLDAGTECRPLDPANPCDIADVCDGASDLCAERFAPETTACGGAPSGACDAPDHCSGSSADCVATFLSGDECRPATDTCDVAETCDGTSADCPPDVTSCTPGDDAGALPGDDAGVLRDAGVADGGARDAAADALAPDGGTSMPPASAGCACRAGMGGARSSWPLGLALAALALRRRRRR